MSWIGWMAVVVAGALAMSAGIIVTLIAETWIRNRRHKS